MTVEIEIDLISHSTGMEVYIENDANCAALAELWLGNAKEYHDVIFVVIGSGIGGAIVKDKKSTMVNIFMVVSLGTCL